MIDERPIRFCPRCQEDTILLPNGRCAWCETLVEPPTRVPVERFARIAA